MKPNKILKIKFVKQKFFLETCLMVLTKRLCLNRDRRSCPKP